MPRVGSSDAGKRTLQARSSSIIDIIFAICHPRNASSEGADEDLRAQVKSLMASNKSVFVDANAAVPVASPQDALELKAACGLSNSAFRLLRTWMQSHGVDVLPSEHCMRAHSKTLLAGIEYETGVHPIVGSDDKFTWARLKNVASVLALHVERLFDDGQLVWASGQPLHRLQVVLTGDKGGTTTKVQLQFMNMREPQAERACLMLGQFAATDKYEYVKVVFEPVFKELAAAVTSFKMNRSRGTVAMPLPQSLPAAVSAHCARCFVQPASGVDGPPTCPSVVTITGIDVLLGGDINWMHMLVGLSTCSGKHFCCACELTKDQLQGLRPLAVGAPRTYEGIVQLAARFEAAGRPREDMKEDEYKNCINLPLVPLPLTLAPPILHCMIGVVGKCVKRLLYAAQELDIEAEERGAVDMSAEAEAYRVLLRAADAARREVIRHDGDAVEARVATGLAKIRGAPEPEVAALEAAEAALSSARPAKEVEAAEYKEALAQAHAEQASRSQLGPFTLSVLRRFTLHSIVMEAQHGGTLNGHSCLRLLEHHVSILGCLDNRPLHTAEGVEVRLGDGAAKAALLSVLDPLHTICTLGMRVSPLCAHERAVFKSTVDIFNVRWREAFPRDEEDKLKEKQREEKEEKKRSKEARDDRKRKRTEQKKKEKDEEEKKKALAKQEKAAEAEMKAARAAGQGKEWKKDEKRYERRDAAANAEEKKRRKEDKKESHEQRAVAPKRRKEEEEEDKHEEEMEKMKPKRAKLEVMGPTPKTHWLLHMKPFVDSYHSVSTMVIRPLLPPPPPPPP
ncbi:MAG: DUF1280 domain-containing protein, partial [Methylibium sp.]|nr:DUF1280 domain-containing protein [Methylibium sp.]